MEITGKSRLFPIIGDPVEEVFSPAAFNAWFDDRRLNCAMIPLNLPSDALPGFWSVLRESRTVLGCSVTYPHKRAAFEAVDEMTGRAARLGALNTIRRGPGGRLSGDATDGEAMCAAIERKAGNIAGKTAEILGAAGGAGQAIADALCARGVTGLSVIDRNGAGLDGLIDMLDTHWPKIHVTSQHAQAHILINATTLGKKMDDPVPFSQEQVNAADIVCDTVTADIETSLVRLANGMGKHVVTGADMGAEQLAPQCRFLGLNAT